MKTISQWFALYGESHQNPTNILIHKIAVPLIYFSVVCLITAIPGLLGLIILSLCVLVAIGFYFSLDIKLGLLMSLYTGVCIYISMLLNQNQVMIAAGIFIIAWVFQFIGHKIEGKKPSFLDDLSFLLIGPAWVFKDLYVKNKKEA